ncbi:MAG: DNA pilot protein [Arizlama microvirus]|nr:MAG: DNA pilot protein [Arizlama microvirus]
MPVDPSIIVAGAQAATTLATTGANAYSTGKTNRKSREYNKEMYERQKYDNDVRWERQNEYNSPLNQMKRLKAAGLNPNLVYGQGAVANSAQQAKSADVQSYNPKAPEFDINALSGLAGKYYDIKNQPLQTDNLKKQNAVLDEEVNLKKAQALNTLSHTDINKFDLAQKDRLKDISAEAAEQALRKLKVDTQYTTEQNTRSQLHNEAVIDEIRERITASTIGRKKTRSEINEIAEKIKNLKTEGKIKEFESYLNSLGLTPHDNAYLRKLELGAQDSKKYTPSAAQNNYRNSSGDWGTRAARMAKKYGGNRKK